MASLRSIMLPSDGFNATRVPGCSASNCLDVSGEREVCHDDVPHRWLARQVYHGAEDGHLPSLVVFERLPRLGGGVGGPPALGRQNVDWLTVLAVDFRWLELAISTPHSFFSLLDPGNRPQGWGQ